ncbi:hypothetical protein [Paenibacillus whitsoniae]|uniref:DUF2334 domain-containing protein n=1 Tax=Paenibacillus whitsoniae TaxID=2496558 RepID=A0A430JJ89_9BACL|nr:hypothetical protein [Paenibacillus whitsoniae]RTE11078.1 hypothetical protein EJQ19_03880 [Paenibacillus whitsoniae]
MKSKIMALLLVLSCLLSIPLQAAADTAATASQPKSVLMLYDSLAIGTPQEGNIEAMQRLFAGFSVSVTAMSLEAYKQGDINGFDQAVLVRNKADEIPDLPADLARDWNGFTGSLLQIGGGLTDRVRQALHIQDKRLDQDYASIRIDELQQVLIPVNDISYLTSYEGQAYGSLTSEKLNLKAPFGVRSGLFAYIPYMTKGNLTEWSAAYLLRDWLGVQTASQAYVMIEGIYPFSNLALVNQMADRLYDAGIPFIAGVQPTFGNWDYPAMQRYMETLKHIQARNGSIVVQTPIVDSTSPPAALKLPNEMSSFLNQLGSSGIAPLGIATEMYWSYDKQYTADALSFFDSGIVYPNKKAWYREKTNTSSTFASAAYTISEAELAAYGGSRTATNLLPLNTTLVYTFTDDTDELNKRLDAITSNWTTFADYKNEVHTVHTPTNVFSSVSGHLAINGTGVHLNDQVQDVDSAHVYVQEGPQSLTTLFSVQNNILIVLIVVTLLLFGIFIIIGHRLYKRKYEQPWRS